MLQDFRSAPEADVRNHRDAGQEHRQLQLMDAGRLLHHVIAGEIIAALPEHGDHGLRRRVAIDGRDIGHIARCVVSLHPGQPFLVFARILPLRLPVRASCGPLGLRKASALSQRLTSKTRPQSGCRAVLPAVQI